MAARKKRLQSDLRNAKRTKARLTTRARRLSDGDLIQVMQMREAAKKKEDSAGPSGEAAKDGKAPVAAAANPDSHAAAPQPSQPEIGNFEDGEEEDTWDPCSRRSLLHMVIHMSYKCIST